MFLAVAPLPAVAKNVFPNHPSTGVPDSEVIVAVIDSGIDGVHGEFGGYRGQPGVTNPQIVAWYDFGIHDAPAPGVTWDAATPVPFDGCPDDSCHGTGTASLVGGATVGAFPGVKLAIAKIEDGSGGLRAIEEAIAWATDTVGADIISISLGTIVPVPGAIESWDEAVRHVFEAGALPVVSAGNGLGNAGVRYPSETDGPAFSPYALVVGASGKSGSTNARLVNGYFSNTDPDVIAWGASVRMATSGGGYTVASGTSFSCPLVAGWSARAMQTAMDAGRPADPARIETLITRTAHDMPAVPFAVEGFGFVANGGTGVQYNTIDGALTHAAAGTVPPAAAFEPTTAHAIAQTLRSANTEKGAVTLALPTGASNPGLIGPGAPVARSLAPYSVALAAGDVLEVGVEWTDPVGASVPVPGVDVPVVGPVTNAFSLNAGTSDIDVYLYRPAAGSGPALEGSEIRARSAASSEPGANVEAFTFRAVEAGNHRISIEGFLVRDGGQAYSLSVSVNGQLVAPVYLGDAIGLVGNIA